MSDRAAFDLATEVPDLGDLDPVHFIGVGGIGMSAVARIMLARGLSLSGSDAKDVPVMRALAALGARVAVGFDPHRLTGVRAVVAGSAIRADNPELVAARERGLLVLHRSQALQALMAGFRGVAVAGTNGKTTTSSMLAVVLQQTGLDPSFAIGGELVGAGTNSHDGSGDVFVAEADESDESFLVYTPVVSVVTNVQADHLDHYGTAENVAAAFGRFAVRVRPGGTLVCCADDPGSARLAESAARDDLTVRTYGTHESADVRITGLDLSGATARFTIVDGENPARPVRLQVPGRHNVLNATAAYTAAVALGVDPQAVVAALGRFTGTRRRFESLGEQAGVRFYDDYAHNPAKVAAAVATARQVAAGSRVIVVFQPHLYSRTMDFAAEFGAALSGADEVVVMDVYAAREDPIPGVSGALVAGAVRPAEKVHYVRAWNEVPATVARMLQRGDLVLTVGAGDVTLIGPEVMKLLTAQDVS